jgi:integrase
MAGSMRQRGPGTWELRVYLGLDPDTRRRRYATRTVHGTRRAATVALAALVGDAAYSRLRAGTLGQLLEQWMATASPAWSASTVRETRSLMRCHLVPHLGHIPVTKLTAADIDDVYSHLLRRGGRDNRPLSPGTVHRVHVVLHRALTQAVRWEWIWLNPAAQASPPRVEPADIRPPSVEQVRRLLDAVRQEDIEFFTYLHLAVTTGARRSQLLAVRWSDIDFNHAAVGFSRALVEGNRTGPATNQEPAHLPGRARSRQHRAARRPPRPSVHPLGRSYRRLRLQHRPCRSPALATQLGHQALHHLPAPRRTRQLPVARPAALHGHRHARRRRPRPRGLRAALPRPHLNHRQHLRPRHARRRP